MTQDAQPFALVVRFTVRPGDEAEFDALVEQTTAGIRAGEPGTLVYACHRVEGARASGSSTSCTPTRRRSRPTKPRPIPGTSWPRGKRCWRTPRSTSSLWRAARPLPAARRPPAMADSHLVGERIAYHRKRLGLSQVEFAALVGRSESWVSQVERGVRSVDRMSVLQKVADVLTVPSPNFTARKRTAAVRSRTGPKPST